MSKVDMTYELSGEFSEDCSQLILEHPKIWKRVLGSWVGKKLLIKVSIFRDKRSDKQNRYIHGVVVPCVQAWIKETQGEKRDHDEVYLWLRISVLGHKAEVREVMGEQVVVMTGKRFSKMNTKEFAEAIDDIIKRMDEKGCYIPLPNENNFISDIVIANQ